tara:strand:+ start:73 stop:192 length:120 start_codon:yes stop_codon:yes gene_type:complete
MYISASGAKFLITEYFGAKLNKKVGQNPHVDGSPQSKYI